MGLAESKIQDDIFIKLNRSSTARLFRNNIGQGYVGKTTRIDKGFVTLQNFRPIRYGVCNPGGSDLIGFTSVEITKDMVGKKVAVFTAIETKTKKGKATQDQANFINVVRHFGGFAGVARSYDDAVGIINPIAFI